MIGTIVGLGALFHGRREDLLSQANQVGAIGIALLLVALKQNVVAIAPLGHYPYKLTKAKLQGIVPHAISSTRYGPQPRGDGWIHHHHDVYCELLNQSEKCMNV